jgi:hypothetical protein
MIGSIPTKRTKQALLLSAAGALVLGGFTLGTLGTLGGCGGSEPPPKTATVSPGGSKDPSKWPKDDRTMCEWRNKPELEVSETSGPGALKPNVRRVYKSFAETETTSHHKSLVCREIDTNLDGIKDVVRTFNAKGEAQHEEADTNYDGKVDVWMNFVLGRLAEENVDTNYDGKPDVWKVYQNGQLSRIKRDRNQDGKPDVWEIYTRGTLERAGVDDTFDGHVDRWDRDDQIRQAAENEEQKAREAMQAAGTATATPTQESFVDAGALGTGGKAKDAGAPKKK